jgi:hypothetical protein
VRQVGNEIPPCQFALVWADALNTWTKVALPHRALGYAAATESGFAQERQVGNEQRCLDHPNCTFDYCVLDYRSSGGLVMKKDEAVRHLEARLEIHRQRANYFPTWTKMDFEALRIVLNDYGRIKRLWEKP